MRIKYNMPPFHAHLPVPEERVEEVGSWVRCSLNGQYKKKERFTKLFSILLERHLEAHPEDVGRIAEIIGAEGDKHEILPDPTP